MTAHPHSRYSLPDRSSTPARRPPGLGAKPWGHPLRANPGAGGPAVWSNVGPLAGLPHVRPAGRVPSGPLAESQPMGRGGGRGALGLRYAKWGWPPQPANFLS